MKLHPLDRKLLRDLWRLRGQVLAIGLVVDDSIVVLENIHRRAELNESPMVAAVPVCSNRAAKLSFRHSVNSDMRGVL